MMHSDQFINQLKSLVAKDKINEVIRQLKSVFENSPKLNSVLIQASRHRDIMRQIQLGIVDFDDANITKNKIRLSLLELIDDINAQTDNRELKEELQQAIQIVNSKNILIESTIQADGDVTIGDTIYTESKSSLRLKYLLYIVVPLIAVAGSYFYYQQNVLKKPISLAVNIQDPNPNSELDSPKGTAILSSEDYRAEKTSVDDRAFFEAIPANLRNSKFHFQYISPGFQPIDTTFLYTQSLNLVLARDDSYSKISGYVFEENENSITPLEGVAVSISCCSTTTDRTGKFILEIPSTHQAKKHRIDFTKEGYQSKSTTEPVIKGNDIRTFLVKK